MALSGFLKQSTAVTVTVGPFVDSTDGDTAETALTVTSSEVRLSKNGANIAAKNDATSLTHDEIGLYSCPLDATDTNTLGILTLAVHEGGSLHVRHDYMVMPANVWDSFYSTDALQVDVVEASATQAEPGQGSPPATDSWMDKIGYMYKSWRNHKDASATLFQLYNDDATTVHCFVGGVVDVVLVGVVSSLPSTTTTNLRYPHATIVGHNKGVVCE